MYTKVWEGSVEGVEGPEPTTTEEASTTYVSLEEEYDDVQGDITYRNERSTPKANPEVGIWCAVKVYERAYFNTPPSSSVGSTVTNRRGYNAEE